MLLRKGLAFFLGVSLLVGFVVLALTLDSSAVSMVLTAKKGAFVLALGAVCCAWCCDSVRFLLIARAAGEKIPFSLGILLTWLNYFGCAITPMQGGGGPFQVFVLYRYGVSLGTGIAVTLVRTLLTLFLLGIIVPISFFFYPEVFQGELFLRGLFWWVFFFMLFSGALVGVSLFSPRRIKRLGGGIIFLLSRIRALQLSYPTRLVRKIYGEVDEYNKIFRLFFSKGKLYFMAAILFSCAHLFCLFAVLPCLIWGFGLPVHFGECLVVQGMFMFLLYFVPTPGASGVAEGGGAAIFSFLVPWNLAGVTALLWRFFTEYLAIFMGAVVAVKFLGWSEAEKLLEKKDSTIDES